MIETSKQRVSDAFLSVVLEYVVKYFMFTRPAKQTYGTKVQCSVFEKDYVKETALFPSL